MRRNLFKSFALLMVLALLFSMWPAALAAQPPQPSREEEPAAATRYPAKPKDIPNPIDAKRLAQREQLLTSGHTAEAAALAKTGKDKLLVILVEFGGSDTVTWNPGDIWDPIANPDAEDYSDYGDCSGVITEAQTFTYTGPLHNELPKPTSKDDRAYDAMWTADFGQQYYQDLLFGNGAQSQYTLDDGTPVNIDLRGYSMRQYFEEQSRGLYTVEGDVIGWVQVPHSEAWYGADACPGGRSAGYSGLADGYFPNGGTPQTLVKDAVDACVAADPNFNWEQYDQNGDGVLDRVMIVHAGYGEEDSTTLLKASGIGENAIWSHSSSVYPAYDIGDSGVKIGAYTIMPENGLTGVFAHEFAHNIGAQDLYAYQPGETSPGFWTLMDDDWGGGWPDSAVPPGLDPWHKYLLGWNDPVVLDTFSQSTEVTLGQSSQLPEGTEDSVIVNLPAQIEQPVVPAQGNSMWYSGKTNWRDAKLTLAAPLDLSAVTSPTLTFKTFYDTEEGWDFGFVQASTDGGATWASLPGTTTTSQTDPSCYFIAELPGYSGFSGTWLDEVVDLSAYAGQSTVLLRFRYETDPATLGMGWYLDDIKVSVGDQVVFADDAETANSKFIVEDWTRTDGYAVYPQYYIAEWRNAVGFDAGLVNGRYNIKDFGMLLWYRNTKYTANEVYYNLADPPAFGSKGACLLVDAHFEPWRYSTTGYVNEVANIYGRIQMRDAAFGLRSTQTFHVSDRIRGSIADEEFPSRPAVSVFTDSLGWYPGLEKVARGPGDSREQWFTKEWDSSCVIPAKGDYGVAPLDYPNGEPLRFGGAAASGGRSAWWWYTTGVGYGGSTGNPGEKAYGVHIAVIEEASDLSWGKVRVWNDTDTFAGEMTVDKATAAPGDELTYTVHIKDAASTSALGTLDIMIPANITYIADLVTGARFMEDSSKPGVGVGHIIWGGSVGGKVLHTPDAHITYKVKVNADAKGEVQDSGLFAISGGNTYKLTAETTLPSVSVKLDAPAFTTPRGTIRYTLSVTNQSTVALSNISVNASWTGAAYLAPGSKQSWTIDNLAPGATWTRPFSLLTFSTGTGNVVATATVTQAWIEATAASATTSIVR